MNPLSKTSKLLHRHHEAYHRGLTDPRRDYHKVKPKSQTSKRA